MGNTITASGSLEKDPNGLHANAPGAKLDHGKVRAGLVLGDFSRALHAVAEVGTYGAEKYSDSGWLQVENGESRYTDAMIRHWMKESTGEELDPDTDFKHAAHAAWNALARLELMVREDESYESIQ